MRSARGLAVLDGDSSSRELNLASELFHRINRVIPEEQRLFAIGPDTTAKDAIQKMSDHGYSQVPVMDGDHVLGVFSFRSFAKETAGMTLADLNKDRQSPGELPVEEFLEPWQFARVDEDFKNVFSVIDRDNGVLIGAPNNLIGILTPMDFLLYLHHVAAPFVAVSEIELAIRTLLRIAWSEDKIAESARRCLVSIYGDIEKVPTVLEEMSFDNYATIISHGDHWSTLEFFFGGTRHRTASKLKVVNALRNDLFHFKRELDEASRMILEGHRDWLRKRLEQAERNREREEGK